MEDHNMDKKYKIAAQNLFDILAYEGLECLIKSDPEIASHVQERMDELEPFLDRKIEGQDDILG